MAMTVLLAVQIEDTEEADFLALSADERRAFVFQKLGERLPPDSASAVSDALSAGVAATAAKMKAIPPVKAPGEAVSRG